MNTQTNGKTTDTERLALIASRLQAVRLRRAIRNLGIDDTVAVNDGMVTRPKSRLIRYEVDGLTVKRFHGKWADCADRMLVYLGLETVEMQRERDDRLQEAMEEVA